MTRNHPRLGAHWLLCALIAAAAATATDAATAANAVAGPAEAENPAYMWDLGDLFGSPQEWTAEHDRVFALSGALEKYKGTLGKSADDMLAALRAMSDVKKAALRLGTYATLKADENVKTGANQERAQSARMLGTTIDENTAWMTPEIIQLGGEKIRAFEEQSPELSRRFGFFLGNALRYAPHTLGAEAEGVMAAAGNVLSQPNVIFSQLANGELPFPVVTLSDGSKSKLDAAGYTQQRQSPNREDRKKVFDAFWQTFAAYQGTFGAALTTQVIGEEMDARVRHFPDALSDAAFSDNMPETVYRMLVSETDKNLGVLYRYFKLRKAALGITDEMRYYDVYPAIFDLNPAPQYSVDQSEKIALDVTAVYGAEYTALLKRGFAGRWMNLYPHPGKAGGAYMNPGAYDVHPYLLFNNHDDYESLSTFVHEWGHAVHSLLEHTVQPFENANYSAFIAETASITNEMLLNDYMVAHAKNDAEKLYYLGQGLELIRGTFFRQTMFAEFQLAIHEEVEKGGSLSGERMTSLYCGLLKKYHGDAQGIMSVDPAYCVEWAYIPHFYYGFYVYQYATSMAGAAQFAEALEKQGAPARARYIAMLKAGGSDYPYELYKRAGLDMATPAPYEALMTRMTRIMDQIEVIQRKHR